jgi:hypothetical protein
VLTTLGAFMIKRAVSAAKASGAAGRAMGPKIDWADRWAQCLAVREGYITGNAEAALLAEKAAEAKAAAEDGKKKDSEKKIATQAVAFDKWALQHCKSESQENKSGDGVVTHVYDCSAGPTPGASAPASPTGGSDEAKYLLPCSRSIRAWEGSDLAKVSVDVSAE